MGGDEICGEFVEGLERKNLVRVWEGMWRWWLWRRWTEEKEEEEGRKEKSEERGRRGRGNLNS